MEQRLVGLTWVEEKAETTGQKLATQKPGMDGRKQEKQDQKENAGKRRTRKRKARIQILGAETRENE